MKNKQNWYQNTKEKAKTFVKNNKRIVRTLDLIGMIGLGNIIFPGIGNAGLIHGKVYDAWNGQNSDSTQVETIINDGSSGTQGSKVPEFSEPGEWYAISGNFSPPPEIGDTVKISGSLTIGKKNYTTHSQGLYGTEQLPYGKFPTAFLDDPDKDVIAHAIGTWNVDVTNAGVPNAEGWLNKNPDQKIPFWNYKNENSDIDTSDIYPQVYLNLEKQDSIWNQGDSVTIRLYKEKGDTTWEADTTFPIDTLKHGGATMLEDMVFPERMYVSDTTPPEISSATEWPDTTHQGPYVVSYTRTDESGIATDDLIYKVNQGDEKTVPADSVVGNKAYCTINTNTAPGDSVHYKVKAVDASDNVNESYWPEQNKWQDFFVKPIAVPENPSVSEKGFEAWYSKGSLHITGTKEASIKDIAGRTVGYYGNKSTDVTGTYGFDVPSGVYFVTADEGPAKGKTKKVVKMK